MSAAGNPSSADEPVRHSTRASFGPILQQERQQRGISLEDVARDTRLARRYLLALENESLDDLPGGPYNRAYLRTYAEFLGLDANSLVRDYDLVAQVQCETGRLVAEPDTVAAMRAVIQRRGSQTTGGTIAMKNTVRVVVLGGAALLIGTMWIGVRHFTRSAETPPTRSSSPPALVVSDAAKERIEVSAIAPVLVTPDRPESAPGQCPLR